MQNKNVLVTGGAGFIGSHTVDELLKNYSIKKIYIVDNLSNGNLDNINHLKKNNKIEFIKKDINNLKKEDSFLKKLNSIIHFAGSGSIVPSIENPKKYLKDNFNGTLNLLEISKFNKIYNFTYAASSSCYGLAKTPTDEKQKISCESPYALSKYLGECAVLHYGKVYRFRANSIRIFNAFGPRINTKGVYGSVFPVFFKQFLENRALTVVGSGNQKRDYIYVSDLAKAFTSLTFNRKINQEIFNVGSGRPVSINYLIKRLCGYKYPIVRLPNRPAEPKITFANISKIKKQLNWKPIVTFEDGLEIMKKNLNYWKKTKLWNKENIKKETKTWFKYLS